MYDHILNGGWPIIKYEEKEYIKYNKIFKDKNIKPNYENEGDDLVEGFNIYFTEDSLKKVVLWKCLIL